MIKTSLYFLNLPIQKSLQYLITFSRFLVISKTLQSKKTSSAQKKKFFITRTPSFLVSDVDTNPTHGEAGANAGVTLPDGNNAIYNITLSPFFFNYSGYPNLFHGNIDGRSEDGRFWSSKASSSNSANDLTTNQANIYPHHRWTRLYPYSLRCLVSTNNG